MVQNLVTVFADPYLDKSRMADIFETPDNSLFGRPTLTPRLTRRANTAPYPPIQASEKSYPMTGATFRPECVG